MYRLIVQRQHIQTYQFITDGNKDLQVAVEVNHWNRYWKITYVPRDMEYLIRKYLHVKSKYIMDTKAQERKHFITPEDFFYLECKLDQNSEYHVAIPLNALNLTL
jgi:hypothetical protein